MRTVLIIKVLLVSLSVYSQNQHNKRIVSLTPALNTEVNGIGVGLSVNSLKYKMDTLTYRVRGVNVELLGVGFVSIFSQRHPLFLYSSGNRDNMPWIHQEIRNMKSKKGYQLDGISISTLGTGGHNVAIRGIAISGLGQVTSRTYGISIALIRNINGLMHGVSVGIFNECIEHKGIQIGIVNRSLKSKGLQIGLWNINEKRSLPLINWSFKNKTDNNI